MLKKNEATLIVKNAEFNYGNKKILDRVSVDIFPGEILVLLGPNGAGKSTLVKAITGRVQLQSGQISVNGANPADSATARKQSGLVPQQLAIFNKLSPLENLSVFGHVMGLKRRETRTKSAQLIEALGLQDVKDVRSERLSGGMKRRVNIGAALMHDPKLLILDEPTVGLDFDAQRNLHKLLRWLKHRNLAILLTTHDMEEAEQLADRVAIIVRGKIHDVGRQQDLIHKNFGEHQEIYIKFREGVVQRLTPDQRVRLQQLNLQPGNNRNSFVGLVSMNDSMTIVRELISDNALTEDFRLHQPGLETLLENYLRAE